jgi:hypothetical protein
VAFDTEPIGKLFAKINIKPLFHPITPNKFEMEINGHSLFTSNCVDNTG